MSDELPDTIRFKLYKKVLSHVIMHQKQQDSQQEDPEKLVYSKLLDDRAVELLEKLKLKYPDVYKVLVNELYRAIRSGLVSGIDGYTVQGIINALGLNVRPELRIKFVKHGKEVDLKDYLG
ncbi:MAG: hypothetical protein QXU03_06125 [Desulfurococcaceae archaeon]